MQATTRIPTHVGEKRVLVSGMLDIIQPSSTVLELMTCEHNRAHTYPRAYTYMGFKLRAFTISTSLARTCAFVHAAAGYITKQVHAF